MKVKTLTLFAFATRNDYSIIGQANSDKCCQVKTVGGKKYVLVDPEGTTPESCKDSCVYAYANAGNGERFCLSKLKFINAYNMAYM